MSHKTFAATNSKKTCLLPCSCRWYPIFFLTRMRTSDVVYRSVSSFIVPVAHLAWLPTTNRLPQGLSPLFRSWTCTVRIRPSPMTFPLFSNFWVCVPPRREGIPITYHSTVASFLNGVMQTVATPGLPFLSCAERARRCCRCGPLSRQTYYLLCG
jgi:hypothetical protein